MAKLVKTVGKFIYCFKKYENKLVKNIGEEKLRKGENISFYCFIALIVFG